MGNGAEDSVGVVFLGVDVELVEDHAHECLCVGGVVDDEFFFPTEVVNVPPEYLDAQRVEGADARGGISPEGVA